MKTKIILLLILILASFLRFYQIDKYPSGINADEAAIGYNVYSLLETGKDEHGHPWPLVFQSFNDYKPPFYFYLTLPFIKLNGLNTISVRLPSAILGIFSVLLIYLLSLEIFKNKHLSLISALLLAISPWHLHFSRGGWEVNAATTLLLLGVWCFVKGLSNNRYLFICAISISLSLYTYHSIRLIVPILGIFLVINFFKEIKTIYKTNPKALIFSLIIFILTIVPLSRQMFSTEGQSRFGGVSIFADQGPLWQALAHRREHDNSDSIFVKMIHNRYLSYSIRFAQNYLSHFSPKYLFVSGDEIARNKVPEMGQSYSILFPFLIFGLYKIIQRKTKYSMLILFWFFVSPVAAALTFQSPHALRSQNMTIPLTIITAIGIFYFFAYLYRGLRKTSASQAEDERSTKDISSLARNLRPLRPGRFHNKFRKINIITIALFFLILSYSFARYLHLYYIHYPKELAYAWEYGFDQVADYIQKNQNKYDRIIISDTYDQPYIILAFYLKYSPSKLQQEIELTPRDKYGFSTVRKFGKFEFRQINYDQDKTLPKTLLVSTKENVPKEKILFSIYSPLGETFFNFIDTNFFGE